MVQSNHLVKPLPPRRGLRHKPWLRGALIFATLVVLVDALVGESGLRRTMLARGEYAEASARLQLMREANGLLHEQARRLAEDPQTIELAAREQLGVIRPGELLFRLRPVR